MKTNNDPSTGSGTNKSPNVEELTDEQLKQVAGGESNLNCMGISKAASDHCITHDNRCKCAACEEGYVLHLGRCVPQ